ncbi:hypothetical protein B7486_67550, partial [cyanobacterium TDX16]
MSAVTVPDLGALPPMDLPARLERLVGRFEEAGIDALLVTDLLNVRYLTGFSGSAGLLAVTHDGLTLVTDGRYGEQAPLEAAAAGADVDVQVAGTGQKDLVSELLAAVPRLGLEAEHVTWAQQRSYATDWFPESELVATEGLVAGLREVKDDGEV